MPSVRLRVCEIIFILIHSCVISIHACVISFNTLEVIIIVGFAEIDHKNVLLVIGLPLQVVQYLAGCGLQSCVMLVRNGYPDIGWNPVEGERYLDFLRFAVFCNGEN